MAMQYMITAKAGFTRGSSWIVEQKALVIGRSYRCDIVVDDGTVSRQHCRVIRVLDGIRLEDLGSRNPALVDGVPEKDVVLEIGDEFSVGRAVFLVTAVAASGGRREQQHQDSETISVDLRDLGLDGLEQHGAWPDKSVDYILLFRFCRVCSHLKSEEALANQLKEIIGGRFGPARVVFIRERDEGWPVAEKLGAAYAEIVPAESIDRALEERRAFSFTAPPGSPEGDFVFITPLYYGGNALGLALLAMGDLGDDGDRESVLKLFSALSEVVGPYIHAAREHEQLLDLNKRLSAVAGTERMPLVGASPAMATLRNLVSEAARTPLSVLITGETGTGKELIARAVHMNSKRADKPYIVVNCAAIPANLLESEFFGHERGAFTGAHAAKRGLLSLADKGTLFLDEVGDLSPENQARMLRVLENGTYRPVGGTGEIKVNIRFIAATNRPVDDTSFRSDLFHRLAGFNLQAPPLRDRVQDVPVLAQYFLDLLASEDDRLLHVLSEDAIQVLSEYHWPGNVRELRNLVERVAHRTSTTLISAEDIWRDGHIHGAAPKQNGPLRTIAELEREHVLKVLRTCKGNRAKSARILGISRSTLYLKLADYGVDE